MDSGERWLGLVTLCAAFLVTGAGHAQVALIQPVHVRAPDPTRQIPAQPQAASVSDGFSVAAVGDLIITHPAADDPDFLPVEKLLKSTDVTFGNFEDSALDPYTSRIWPSAENGGDYLYGLPPVVTDLKEMGFNLLGHANNHGTDWGIPGMEMTDRTLDKAGLVHAGSGSNLSAARAPGYLTTRRGRRVALVAMTSSFQPDEAAGESYRGVAGRPGINVLPTTSYHVVTERQMAGLRDVFNSQPEKPLHPAGSTTKHLDLFGTNYCVGTTYCADMGGRDRAAAAPGVIAPGISYKMDAYALDGILRSIREGKEASDFEIAYIHTHEPGEYSQVPPDFLRTLAHEAIDTGADEFVASGPHQLRGIEIYKNKPIFYSLGNFFFEDGTLGVPWPDLMRYSHLDPDATTDYEYQQFRLNVGMPDGNFNGTIWYQSVLAISTFNHEGDIQEIKLYPVDLGFQRARRPEGAVPLLASPKVAQEILLRLRRLSKPYGTDIEIQGNVGVIRIAARE